MSNSDEPDTPTGCQVCSAPTGDDGYLCRTHTEDLRDQLAGVEALVAELDVTITRQARTTRPSEGGRSPERPLPWNENASARAFELNATLNAWALDVSKLAEDERDWLIHVHHSDTTAVGQWLVRNLSTLRMHREAGIAYDELRESIREARRAIDRPADPVPFGPCNQVFPDGTVCQEILYGQLDRQHVKCRACDTMHPTRERLTWMLEHLRGMLATLPELVTIASLAGKRTTEDKLRLMADRGRFDRVGIDAAGKPTFRVSDALKALDERYKHRPKVAGAA